MRELHPEEIAQVQGGVAISLIVGVCTLVACTVVGVYKLARDVAALIELAQGSDAAPPTEPNG